MAAVPFMKRSMFYFICVKNLILRPLRRDINPDRNTYRELYTPLFAAELMITLFLAACLCISCVTSGKIPEGSNPENAPVYSDNNDSVSGEKVVFTRILGYVPEKSEDQLEGWFPLTDVGYFATDVDCYGHLTDIPDRSNLSSFSGTTYLVTTCSSRSLTHFVLDPEYSVRNSLIDELATAACQFDGIQIDYEYVPMRDGVFFLQFLIALKKKIGKKLLSVCVPARIRMIENDIYSYKAIASVADSIVVMAYDEHWSGSEPGPVASMDWCRRVAAYAKEQIPADKLIMGIPLYGRSWGNTRVSGAWKYPTVSGILQQHRIDEIERKDSIPYFQYTAEVHVVCWFEDAVSVIARCRMYSDMGIKNISLWCIGQEDREIWKWLVTESVRDTDPVR
jgi:spore germination protein